MFCDQLVATAEVAGGVPADPVGAGHQQIDEVVDHDRDRLLDQPAQARSADSVRQSRPAHASEFVLGPQSAPDHPTGFRSVSGQRSDDWGERVGRAGADDEVGEAELFPSPLDFLARRHPVAGEDGQ
jgi:hypothetical protein